MLAVGLGILGAACGQVAIEFDARPVDAANDDGVVFDGGAVDGSIDAAGPAHVVNVTSSVSNGTYTTPTLIDIRVAFSAPVTVTGTPQIELNSGAAPVDYATGSGSPVLTFLYTIAAGEESADLDYSGADALSANGGTIVGASGAADLLLPEPGGVGSLGYNHDIAVDAVSPRVTGVTSSTPDGTYGAGSVISIQVVFDEVVVVTGTPTLTLNSGAPAVGYTGGSGSTTLTFNYTVGGGQASADLDYASTSALAAAGGSIRDPVGNSAILTLATPGAVGSLGYNKALVVVAGCSPGSVTFSYTGSMQYFTVPSGCTGVVIDAYGAQGGTSVGESGGLSYTGGLGARARGTFAVTGGQVIDVLVGSAGATNTASVCGSGGGGGSWAVRSGSLLLVAGGGGGGFHCNYYGGANGGPGVATTSGGSGVLAAGGNPPPACTAGGTGGNGANAYFGGGGGGWLTAGSSTYDGSGGDAGGRVYPGAPAPVGGGYGGGGGSFDYCCGGSGGGGGYSGGGGGTQDGCAGGGGGSYNSGTVQTMTAGVRSGHGQVTVSYY